jgi:hypothetical protein
MAGNHSYSIRTVCYLIALFIALAAAPPSAEAYRICTFRGSVIDHGWRTMSVKSNGQCAVLNVGWRTKYIPNKRPCVGERVAVDFVLENGYMRATKVVSLTPPPLDVQCYPPAPPGTTECRSVEEKAEDPCVPPKPICSRTPPPHVGNGSWTPPKESGGSKEPKERVEQGAETKPEAKPEGKSQTVAPSGQAKPDAKPQTKKPVKPSKTKETAKAPGGQEPVVSPPKDEKKEPATADDKAGKSLNGEVVASSPKSLSIRVTEAGKDAEVINVRVGLKTRFIPFRRPAVGERVKVDYRTENDEKFGYTVQVVQ